MGERAQAFLIRVKRMNQRFMVRIRRSVPPGARLILGLLLIIGGIFGVLPVLGFWMIPLGLAVAALDIRPLMQWLRRRNTDYRK